MVRGRVRGDDDRCVFSKLLKKYRQSLASQHHGVSIMWNSGQMRDFRRDL